MAPDCAACCPRGSGAGSGARRACAAGSGPASPVLPKWPKTPAIMVIDQTRRRLLEGESVPAADKIVSIFEDHTDIIRKDARDTLYGHKICLAAGTSSLVFDCQILEGNPPDSTLAVTMIERHAEIHGRVPRQVAFDGGFSSRSNLDDIKELVAQSAKEGEFPPRKLKIPRA